MAAPLLTQDVLGVFKAFKDDVQQSILTPRGLSIKSAGTKTPNLVEPLDTISGFWRNPSSVSSKPPRWIIPVETDAAGAATAHFGVDPTGLEYPMARTIGYINNRDGSCAVCVFRVLISARPFGEQEWSFPRGWECLLIIAFSRPLPAGTSGDMLSNFNAELGTIEYGGGNNGRRPYPMAMRAIVAAPSSNSLFGNLNYSAACQAVANLIGATFFDGSLGSERERLATTLSTTLAVSPSVEPFSLEEDLALVGVDPDVYRQVEAAVNSGKRHIILYGPPGTGKTTLAEYIARELSERDEGDGSYGMLTASSSWSAQDLVGGYQPIGGGNIGFIPGALLRDFNKPVIIDELNRCPIDKVLGPLFSVLSGQSSTLPCRVNIADPSSPFHVILPERRDGMAAYEHAPSPAWRLICTLNTYDKTQLGQISYALSRRFAWIKVSAPADPYGFVSQMAARLGLPVPENISSNPIAEMWKAVNASREIGGAPIVDMLRTMKALNPRIDIFSLPIGTDSEHFLAAFRMCTLPLMDGLSPREANDLASGISAVWALDPGRSQRLAMDCREFSA